MQIKVNLWGTLWDVFWHQWPILQFSGHPNCMSDNSIQFWRWVPRVSVRFHRFKSPVPPDCPHLRHQSWVWSLSYLWPTSYKWWIPVTPSLGSKFVRMETLYFRLSVCYTGCCSGIAGWKRGPGQGVGMWVGGQQRCHAPSGPTTLPKSQCVHQSRSTLNCFVSGFLGSSVTQIGCIQPSSISN